MVVSPADDAAADELPLDVVPVVAAAECLVARLCATVLLAFGSTVAIVIKLIVALLLSCNRICTYRNHTRTLSQLPLPFAYNAAGRLIPASPNAASPSNSETPPSNPAPDCGAVFVSPPRSLDPVCDPIAAFDPA